MRLKGKLAVITGGSDGIGLGIARAYAREGATLILIARTEKSLAAAKTELDRLGATAATVAADLAEPGAVERVVERIRADGRPVDILVNNAAVALLVPFLEASRAQFDASVNLNVAVPYFLSQSLAPAMPSGGSIIHLSSYFARKILPGRPSTLYSLTKGAIDALTKAMAVELGARNIRVNAIAPGTVDTPMRRRSIEKLSEAAQAEIAAAAKRNYPLGRIGRVEDLAGIAIYLASDDSAWTTGATFAVDGGLTAN